MKTAPCVGPALAYNHSQALQKREYERSAVPVSDGFFVPGISPDSKLVVVNLQCWGRAGCIRRKAMRRSRIRFLNPPVPGPAPISLS